MAAKSVGAWKLCRKEIVTKMLPFTSFNLPSEYCSTRPDNYYTPMEHIDLSSLSLESQEQHLVKDLLIVYMGFQGNSIRFIKENDTVTWTVNPSADACLRSALYMDACLPLAATVIQLRHNIKNMCSELSRGRVALAVGCAAEEFFNSEILPLLVKLERENRSDQRLLSLAEVATYLRPYMLITRQLNDVLSVIIKKELIGGEVLSLLAEQSRNCFSPTTRDMLYRSEAAGLAQYFEILFWWVHYGKIQDYCHEFMIWDLKISRLYTKSDIICETGDDLKNDSLSSFDDRFCVIKALCPTQLQPAFDDIIKCGTYLNIAEKIKGENVAFDDERVGEEEQLEEWETKNVDDVLREIRKARLKSSKDLVQLLRKQFGLDSYFESFHDFLLLQHSDWLVSFAELSRDMLICPLRDISVKKLQILFEEAVDCSTLHFDNHRHIFGPILEKYDLFTSLRLISKEAGQKNRKLTESLNDLEMESKIGLDALSIRVSVDSPLSLVFPPTILLFYNLFFRTLFYLRSATSQLLSKQMYSNSITLKDRHLLQKMLHFVNAYNLHCSMYVLPRLWDIFVDNLSKSASLEQILAFQNSFLADAMAQCFFPDLDFMNLVSDLFVIIWNFANDKIGYNQCAEQWEQCLEKVGSHLSKPNSNTAYSQLYSRIFSRIY